MFGHQVHGLAVTFRGTKMKHLQKIPAVAELSASGGLFHVQRGCLLCALNQTSQQQGLHAPLGASCG